LKCRLIKALYSDLYAAIEIINFDVIAVGTPLYVEVWIAGITNPVVALNKII
jgi:hypothetical protein